MSVRRAIDPIEQEGRALVECLGGRWSACGGLCRCPAHDDRSPSLSVRAGRTRLLLHCFAGCAPADILRSILADGMIRAGIAGPAVSRPPAGDRLRAAAVRLWSEARPIQGSPAEAYLRSRGLASDSPQLRFHPRTPVGARPQTLFRPALIAAVRNGEGLLAVQRTLLEPEGPSGLRTLKLGLGRFGDGAVRLGGSARRLGLAEGVESALSASALHGLPCWATLGSERFASVSLPPEVEELLLFLDHDEGGRRAEVLARAAFAQVPSVRAFYPPRPGEDWNDVLRARA